MQDWAIPSKERASVSSDDVMFSLFPFVDREYLQDQAINNE